MGTGTTVVGAKVPQGGGGGGGAGVVTWHAELRVAAVLWRVDGLVRQPAWCWSGVGRSHGWDGSCLAGVTAGWRSRGVVHGVVVASRWRGGGVARLTVEGLGRDVGGDERKENQKNALNEVVSRAGGVGGNAGLWAASWRGVLVVEVDGDRGHEFMARRQGTVAVTWSVRNETEKKKKNISKGTRLSLSSSCISRRHGVGAELSRGGVPVVEVDGDGGPRAYPGSWGVSHGRVMVENLRQQRGVWADVWRGGDVVTRVLVTIVVAVGIVDDEMHEVAPME
ncbi:hypothetical protein EDB85DRAFT_1901136 [Lactarius pseudohatsudake]|nr:hypothetical protein EDB85DRAFT_1901136 [Lactarius pseudohatsudake]